MQATDCWHAYIVNSLTSTARLASIAGQEYAAHPADTCVAGTASRVGVACSSSQAERVCAVGTRQPVGPSLAAGMAQQADMIYLARAARQTSVQRACQRGVKDRGSLRSRPDVGGWPSMHGRHSKAGRHSAAPSAGSACVVHRAGEARAVCAVRLAGAARQAGAIHSAGAATQMDV